MNEFDGSMTLDEAIDHLEETLSNQDHQWSCAECRSEHEQLLNWLKELKELRFILNTR